MSLDSPSLTVGGIISSGNEPPPPDPSSSSSPPPPTNASPPPPVSSPPPPERTPSPSPPPPVETKNGPPAEASPSPPSQPREDPSTQLPPPSKSSPSDNPLPPPSTTEQPKSPEGVLSPPARNDFPGSSLAPPHSDSSPGSQLTSQVTGSTPSGSSNSSVVVIVGIAVAGGLILALIVACFFTKRKRKRSYYYENQRPPNGWNIPHSNEHVVKLPAAPHNGVGNGQWGAPPTNSSGEYNNSYSGQHGQSLQPQSPMGGIGFSSQSQFSYEDLAAATSGFSQANLLGQGGFGYVHKGVLPDGKVVAVKSLKSGSGQGEREFQAEVDIISRVHHRHLVSLVGYCIADSQRMLVYEFVPNSTMEHHLHGKGQPVMDWSSRVRIAIGSAKGLAYLHEDCHPRIIHRDIKAANILLDENYEAMVADFGLAKLTTDNFTHVSTRVMGTFGYLAPEYAASGKLSEKSDVFSFGVMLLELITGRPPVDLSGQVMEDSLVDWARPLLAKALEDGDYSELADPNMEGDYDPRQMASMISCAAGSVRHSAKRRPRMSQIVRALEGESLLAEEGSEIPKKARSNGGNGSATTSHDSTYDTVAYNNDMIKFKKMILIDDE